MAIGWDRALEEDRTDTMGGLYRLYDHLTEFNTSALKEGDYERAQALLGHVNDLQATIRGVDVVIGGILRAVRGTDHRIESVEPSATVISVEDIMIPLLTVYGEESDSLLLSATFRRLEELVPFSDAEREIYQRGKSKGGQRAPRYYSNVYNALGKLREKGWVTRHPNRSDSITEDGVEILKSLGIAAGRARNRPPAESKGSGNGTVEISTREIKIPLLMVFGEAHRALNFSETFRRLEELIPFSDTDKETRMLGTRQVPNYYSKAYWALKNLRKEGFVSQDRVRSNMITPAGIEKLESLGIVVHQGQHGEHSPKKDQIDWTPIDTLEQMVLEALAENGGECTTEQMRNYVVGNFDLFPGDFEFIERSGQQRGRLTESLYSARMSLKERGLIDSSGDRGRYSLTEDGGNAYLEQPRNIPGTQRKDVPDITDDDAELLETEVIAV